MGYYARCTLAPSAFPGRRDRCFSWKDRYLYCGRGRIALYPALLSYLSPARGVSHSWFRTSGPGGGKRRWRRRQFAPTKHHALISYAPLHCVRCLLVREERIGVKLKFERSRSPRVGIAATARWVGEWCARLREVCRATKNNIRRGTSDSSDYPDLYGAQTGQRTWTLCHGEALPERSSAP